jgi:hypothetical protein
MWAILAVLAFAIALILHLAGGTVEKYVLDAELIGFICLAIHLVWGIYPWRRGPAA